MRLFVLPDGRINHLDRAAWLTPPFDLRLRFPQTAPPRVYRVAAEARSLRVAAERRACHVARERRRCTVERERRTVPVPRESRTFKA